MNIGMESMSRLETGGLTLIGRDFAHCMLKWDAKQGGIIGHCIHSVDVVPGDDTGFAGDGPLSSFGRVMGSVASSSAPRGRNRRRI